MTTQSTDPSELRWWQYIGPWPIRPVAVTIFVALFFSFTAAASAILETELVANVSFTAQVVSVAAAATATWILLTLAARVQRRHSLDFVSYLGAFLIVASVATVIRTIVGGLTQLIFNSPLAMTSTILRVWVPLVIVNATLGVSTARLQYQVSQTQAALDLARRQQEWLILSDEVARRQVADTLHDQVQASLIAACLHLQSTDPSDRRSIDAVIDRLEELRKVDVRRAARALSPTLSEVGLSSSLSELASQYEPGMVTLVDVDPRLDTHRLVDERTRLGIYRIIEQALLNSAVHGRARVCDVRVMCNDGISIEVDDSGEGFADEDALHGAGGALISTWTRALEGTWSWGNRPEGGARLTVDLPRHTCDPDGPPPTDSPSVAT